MEWGLDGKKAFTRRDLDGAGVYEEGEAALWGCWSTHWPIGHDSGSEAPWTQYAPRVQSNGSAVAVGQKLPVVHNAQSSTAFPAVALR